MKKRRPHSRPGTRDLRHAAAAIEGFPSDSLVLLSLCLTNLKSSCLRRFTKHIICPRLTQARRRRSRLRRLLHLKGFVLKGRDGILLSEQPRAGEFLIWILRTGQTEQMKDKDQLVNGFSQTLSTDDLMPHPVKPRKPFCLYQTPALLLGAKWIHGVGVQLCLRLSHFISLQDGDMSHRSTGKVLGRVRVSNNSSGPAQVDLENQVNTRAELG